MANKHTTKKALLMSVISLLLCCSMLIGTTFAWFTDEVKSGVNQILAGNLDVEVYNSLTVGENKVGSSTMLFDEITYWEPGVVAYENLTVANLGTLALKYQLSVNFDKATTNANGDTLAKVLKVGFVEGGIQSTTREGALTEVNKWLPLESFVQSGKLDSVAQDLTAAKTSDSYGIVIWWEPSSIDNEFNMNNENKGKIMSIELGIKLVATQLTAEDDSFGPDYDAGAPWKGGIDISWYTQNHNAQEFVLDTAEELAGLAAIVNGTATNDMMRSASTEIHDDFAGRTIKLGGDIDLDGNAWTPIGRIGKTSTDFTYAFKGTFDGQNHTISNLDVNAYGWAGVFGLAHSAQINNLKVSGVSIVANRLAGAVVGQLYGSIDNCHVEDAEIMVTPNAVDDSYDNGDKVGGIVGWLGDNGNNRTLTNCSATDVKLSAYRDVGGIAGYVAYSTKIANNKADDIQITVDQVTHFYGEKDPNAGAIWGRNSVSNSGVGVIDENNTAGEKIEITSTISRGGLTYKQDGVSGETTLYLVPADYEGTTVNIAEGTTTIGGYAFAYNSNIEKIVLPSTVTTLNDRAFRGTSASIVVLNEGLTNISYQAFRDALNVKSVVIPSTVTTISKEAFQNSGITALTIPATVTTVEYGACRDMKMVKTVTFEGNADIPVYAFRACTNLKTVVLKGNNVTFGGGSRGMIFTNKENGDGSAITIYVENDTVKERLLAADTAAKDYGGYEIVVGSKTTDKAEDIVEALKKGDSVVLTDDVKTEAATTAPYGNKVGVIMNGGVLDGNGNELYIECYGDDYGIMTSGGTVKNLTIKEGCRAIMIMYAKEDVILDNVKIGGDGVLYPINTGEYAVAEGVDLIVTNSVLAGWTSYAGIESATFTNVAFEQGTYYNDIYGRVLKPYVNTTMTNCSFVEHMNLDLSGLVQGQKITIVNCTVNGQAVTADVFTVPTNDAQYDTELFTVDLPAWASSITDCVSFG